MATKISNFNLDLDDFLDKYNFEFEEWEKSGLCWDDLKAIAHDHNAELSNLELAGEMFSKMIQRFDSVHSVRWRVKDAEHLLAKIVRRTFENVEKYRNINASNYHQIVTDLVGLRALHLFKDECFAIHNRITENWTPHEPPVAYIREGDSQDWQGEFIKQGFEVKTHPASYRSVHYILSTKLSARPVLAEVQVRTIFEEGWSEIDHRVRYPNLSDNPLVIYFLNIFNRLAGSADEMGDFVRELTGELRESDRALQLAFKEKKDAIEAMENAVHELNSERQLSENSRKQIAKLNSEIEKLKRVANDFISEIGVDRSTETAHRISLLWHRKPQTAAEAWKEIGTHSEFVQAISETSKKPKRRFSDLKPQNSTDPDT